MNGHLLLCYDMYIWLMKLYIYEEGVNEILCLLQKYSEVQHKIL